MHPLNGILDQCGLDETQKNYVTLAVLSFIVQGAYHWWTTGHIDTKWFILGLIGSVYYNVVWYKTFA